MFCSDLRHSASCRCAFAHTRARRRHATQRRCCRHAYRKRARARALPLAANHVRKSPTPRRQNTPEVTGCYKALNCLSWLSRPAILIYNIMPPTRLHFTDARWRDAAAKRRQAENRRRRRRAQALERATPASAARARAQPRATHMRRCRARCRHAGALLSQSAYQRCAPARTASMPAHVHAPCDIIYYHLFCRVPSVASSSDAMLRYTAR